MQFNTHAEAGEAIAHLNDSAVEGSGRPLVVKLAEDSRGTRARVCVCWVWLCVERLVG